MSNLVWERMPGKGTFAYWRAANPYGFARIQRINKTGLALVKLRWPDGANITFDTSVEAKAHADADYSRWLSTRSAEVSA